MPSSSEGKVKEGLALQPRPFISYERDRKGLDEITFCRYSRAQAYFEQADPYGGSYAPADPQSFNRYSYLRNDPVNFTDPTGLEKKECDGSWATDPVTGEPYCVPSQDFGGVTVFIGPDEPHPLQAGRAELDSYLSLLIAVRLQLVADPDLIGGGPELATDPNRLNAFEIAILRYELAKLLTDTCTSFLDTLITYNTGKRYNSEGSLLAHYDAVARSAAGGVFWSDRGYAMRGPAAVYLGPRSRLGIGRNAQLVSTTLLHELVHTVTRGSDITLSFAVLALDIPVFTAWGAPTPRPLLAKHYHEYWSGALANACFPPIR